MDKRGQTATEYLIILAVVVIIALIVVGIMGGIPGTPAYVDYNKIGRQICNENNMTYATVTSDNILACSAPVPMTMHEHYNISMSSTLSTLAYFQVDWRHYQNQNATKVK